MKKNNCFIASVSAKYTGSIYPKKMWNLSSYLLKTGIRMLKLNLCHYWHHHCKYLYIISFKIFPKIKNKILPTILYKINKPPHCRLKDFSHSEGMSIVHNKKKIKNIYLLWPFSFSYSDELVDLAVQMIKVSVAFTLDTLTEHPWIWQIGVAGFGLVAITAIIALCKAGKSRPSKDSKKEKKSK